ncbi:response regulator [Leeuwenhoekiella palythoae]|uniref:Response regulator receiver domain-containing protein n=1 Tax=Leeuwenhoekiella palythoae TaxID=573501 RepID=A0A1M5THR0_9FLAO|nr:response regulator [Leeuwenhoekiella palythoae]RXG28657.1 response regulator receiver domain-containing protein [Leeuwenhoekiella palythoae]SHH50190.1 Response regulator receiver domain-containing protein [Leeuwenhoekiella palythoae]
MQGEVLIVDDDKTICLIHKYLLKTVHNIEPRFYTCAGDALKCIADSPNSSKYIIYLDINMPVLNGWDFLERLYQFKNKDRFSVILVTSSIDAVDKSKAKDYDLVQGYIEKPLNKPKISTLDQMIGNFS